MISLACSGLRVGYGSRVVLNDVSLAVEAGETLSLLGPNGGGKSSLLKTLGGLIPKLGGEAEVLGDSLSGLSVREIARRIAFVPQEETWLFDFTVEDVVAMGRMPVSNGIRDTEEDREAARTALARVGATHLAGAAMTQISGGERQRVLIARALAQGGPIVFLDEPTAHLDPRFQAEMATLIRDLGKTVLVAVHDLTFAGALGGMASLIAHGQATPPAPIEDVLTSEALSEAYDASFERLRTESGRLVVTPRLTGGYPDTTDSRP